jgi:hypothetical protein
MSDAKYLVRFRGKKAKDQFSETLEFQDWKPLPEQEFECNEQEALDRFRRLVEAGRYPRSVDDIRPWLVEIIVPVEGAKFPKVMASITCGKIAPNSRDWDVPVGPWRSKAVAVLERKLAA